MARDYLTKLLSRTALVRDVGPRTSLGTRRQAKAALSRAEVLRKAVATGYNQRWPDGRIYGLDRDGRYVSHSVSPFAGSFLENLEDGVRDLILALKQKGYFSISSCQGHCLWDRRYVKLIFPSREAALAFQQALPFDLTYNLKHAAEFLNVSLELDGHGNILNASSTAVARNHSRAVEYVNAFLRRSYADAWFLEVIIADPIPDQLALWKYLGYLRAILFKWFFVDAYTRRLTRFVSRHLPANPD